MSSVDKKFESIDDSSDDALEVGDDEEIELDASCSENDEVEKGDTSSKDDTENFSSVEFTLDNPRVGTKHPFKYKCPYCFKFYTSRSGLTSHKNAVHYRTKPYRCQYCEACFSSSAQRVAHIRRFHDRKSPPRTNFTSISKPIIMNVKSIANEEHSGRTLPLGVSKQNQEAKKCSVLRPILQKTRQAPSVVIIDEHKAGLQNSHVHLISSLAPLPGESYECSECEIHFNFMEDLIQHLRSHAITKVATDDEEEFQAPAVDKCIICGFIPDANNSDLREEKIRDHIISEHFKASFPNLVAPLRGVYEVDAGDAKVQSFPNLRCSVCFKEFDRDSHLKIHFRYHHLQKKNFTCSKCSDVFATEEMFKEHVRNPCKPISHSCTHCSKVFSSTSEVLDHLKTSHPVVVDVTRSKCSNCGKIFISDALLQSHVLSCLQKNLKCPVCEMTFPFSHQLLRHIGVSHNSKRLSCDKCIFFTENMTMFLDHYRKHIPSTK